MGASVQPMPQSAPPAPPPSPLQSPGDRISANVAAMRSQGASDNDVEAYLKQEGLAPDQDTSLSFRNLGRSAVQGATLGWGDEMGLTDRAKQDAFHAAHPVADFFAKIAGGALPAAAATLAAPVLGTTLGGAAALGGGMGLLSGAGEADGGDRALGAFQGGVLGAAGGAGGYGAAKVAGGIASKVLDRMHPERAVAREASKLVTPDVAAKMAQVDQIAPGGASIATTAVPRDGARVSRMLPMLRAVGASADAGTSAEGSLTAQQAALDLARKSLGSKMDALGGQIPVTPDVESALMQARGLLGGKVPAINTQTTALDVQDVRDVLSRLRFMSRQAAKRGIEANGVTTHDINTARDAVQSALYTHAPDFEPLDRQYSIVQDQSRRTGDALKTVQRSRANYSANQAYGATSGSLGGSLPSGTHGVLMNMLDHLVTNKPGAADAVARMIVKPGGPDMVSSLLASVPKTRGMNRMAAPLAAATIPALRGLLFPADSSSP